MENKLTRLISTLLNDYATSTPTVTVVNATREEDGFIIDAGTITMRTDDLKTITLTINDTTATINDAALVKHCDDLVSSLCAEKENARDITVFDDLLAKALIIA